METLKLDSKINKFSLDENMEQGLRDSVIAVVDPICNTFVGFVAYKSVTHLAQGYVFGIAQSSLLHMNERYYSIKELIEDNQQFDYYIL